jgi:hypothetical protein
MAKTGAKIGKKTLFLRETVVDGGVYATVAEVKTIGGPAQSRDAVDATFLESEDDAAEYIAGLMEGGELQLTLNFRPEHVSQGTSAGLYKDYLDGTTRSWQIQFPQFTNTPTLTARGFITGWEQNIAPKELLVITVKIKVTGKVTPTNFA